MTTSTPARGGFDLNRPTIVWLLLVGGLLTGGIVSFVGLVLSYVWSSEAHEAWEESHYRYAQRTFWIGLLYAVLAGLLYVTIILIPLGWLLHLGILLWFAVRSIRGLFAAQRREAVVGVESWLW
jgi:uncharacterized membrane protein